MTPDVQGLLLGAGQAANAGSSAAGAQLGRHTADSPFAVLLASTAAAPGGRAAPDAQAGTQGGAAMPARPGRPTADAGALAEALVLGKRGQALGAAARQLPPSGLPAAEHLLPAADAAAPGTATAGLAAPETGQGSQEEAAPAGDSTPEDMPDAGTAQVDLLAAAALAAQQQRQAQARPQAGRNRRAEGRPGTAQETPAAPAAESRHLAAARGHAGAQPPRTTPGPAAPAAPLEASGTAPVPPALVKDIGTPAPGLEGAEARPDASEALQVAVESRPQQIPAPVPASAGTGEKHPPESAGQAQRLDAAEVAQQPRPVVRGGGPLTPGPARSLHQGGSMGAAASASRRRIEEEVANHAAAGAPAHATADLPATPTAAPQGEVTAQPAAPSPSTRLTPDQAGPARVAAQVPAAARPAEPLAPSLAASEAATSQAPAPHAAQSVHPEAAPAQPSSAPAAQATPSAAAAAQSSDGRAPSTAKAQAPAGTAQSAAGTAQSAAGTAQSAAGTAQSAAGTAQSARRDERRALRPESPAPRGVIGARAAPPRSEGQASATAAPAAAPPAAAPSATAQAMAREVGTSARLTQVSRAGQSLRDPAQPAKAARAAHPVEAGTQPLPGAPAAPQAAESSVRPPAAVQRGAPTLPPEAPQTMVGGTILPHTAHLRLESETLGDLALHLRVRDGVAHVRMEGEQAAQLAGRGQELQRALAAEGLKLGQLEVEKPAVPAAPQGGQARTAADQGAPQGQRQRPERDEPSGAPRQGAAPVRKPTGRSTAHHVEA